MLGRYTTGPVAASGEDIRRAHGCRQVVRSVVTGAAGIAGPTLRGCRPGAGAGAAAGSAVDDEWRAVAAELAEADEDPAVLGVVDRERGLPWRELPVLLDPRQARR